MTQDSILNIENTWKKIKKKHGRDAAMLMPIPVIYSASATDAERITKELAGFIYTAKIAEKTNSGHEDYLFFAAAYSAPHNKNFPAIQELYYHVRDAGGYYGSYRGIILVDVSEWRGHFKDKYFDVFLAYLADCRLNGLIPFFYADCCNSDAEMRTLDAVITSYFSIVRVNVSAADLCKYAVSILENQDIRIDESARAYLEGFFQEASKSALFHGTESVMHICEEVLCKCSPDRNKQYLNEAHLRAIINDLGFWDTYHQKPVKIIGFR